MSEQSTIKHGLGAPPFIEQFPQLSPQEAERLDRLNRAITTMAISGMLSPSQQKALREKRFPNEVRRVLANTEKEQAK